MFHWTRRSKFWQPCREVFAQSTNVTEKSSFLKKKFCKMFPWTRTVLFSKTCRKLFDKNSQNCLPKVQKTSKKPSFSWKVFLNSCPWHVGCGFENPVPNFLPKFPESFGSEYGILSLMARNLLKNHHSLINICFLKKSFGDVERGFENKTVNFSPKILNIFVQSTKLFHSSAKRTKNPSFVQER